MEYEVEEIMACRIRGKGLQFLIRWKGYSEKYDTWEPEKNIMTKEVLLDFVRKLKSNGMFEKDNQAHVQFLKKWDGDIKNVTVLTPLATPSVRNRKTPKAALKYTDLKRKSSRFSLQWLIPSQIERQLLVVIGLSLLTVLFVVFAIYYAQ